MELEVREVQLYDTREQTLVRCCDERPLDATSAGNYRTGVTHVYITDDDLASRKTRSRERRRERKGEGRRRTGGENQARDTSNSFINGLSRRECLRARFSVLLGNRKIHQPDASSPPNSSGLSVSVLRESTRSLSPLTVAISRA